MTRASPQLFAAAAAIVLMLLALHQATATPADHVLIIGGPILA